MGEDKKFEVYMMLKRMAKNVRGLGQGGFEWLVHRLVLVVRGFVSELKCMD